MSTPTYTAITALSPNVDVKRLAGDNHFATAAAIADEVSAVAPTTATAPVHAVGVATGTNWPDALVELNASKPLTTGFVFGGTATVPKQTAATLRGYLLVD